MPRSKTIRFFTPLAVLMGAASFLIHPVVSRAHTARQEAGPPGSPLIDHVPVECVVEQRHPLFRASVSTTEGLHTVKLYFHAQDYNDFYYVQMVDRGDGTYEASLPIPAPETEGFVYYIEAVDLLFNTSRTEEYLTHVASAQDCDSEEGPPPIVVGSTTPGATVIPPGFAATGIERIISSTGAATSVGGGGLGTLGVAAIGGGVAAGVTAGVLAGGGDKPSPDANPPAAPPPDSGPPDGGPTEPEGTDPVACFNTTPNPPVVDINEGIKFDASCSTADKPLVMAQLADKIQNYHWKFGDGRPDKEGRVVNHSYVQAGSFFARLTVTDSLGNKDTTELEITVRGSTAPPPTGGGGGPGPPPPPTDADLSVSGSVFTGGFTVTVSNAGPLVAANVVLSLSCDQPMSVSGFFNCTPAGASASKTCTAASIGVGSNGSVDVTVASGATCQASVTSDTPDSNTSNNTRSATVPQRSPDLIPTTLDTSFLSRLDVPPGDGSVRGQVVLNGASLQETNNSAPFRHQVQGQEGRNTVEARWVAGTGEGRWVFNFTNSPHFVSGSLVAESGQVVVQEARRVVFRVSPSTPSIRFRYRLSD